MKISPVTIYAIQILQELSKGGGIPEEGLIRRLGISRSYVKKALHVLRKAQLVRNKKGYRVVGCPRVYQVVEASEGVLPPQAGDTEAAQRVRNHLRLAVKKGMSEYVTSM